MTTNPHLQNLFDEEDKLEVAEKWKLIQDRLSDMNSAIKEIKHIKNSDDISLGVSSLTDLKYHILHNNFTLAVESFDEIVDWDNIVDNYTTITIYENVVDGKVFDKLKMNILDVKYDLLNQILFNIARLLREKREAISCDIPFKRRRLG